MIEYPNIHADDLVIGFTGHRNAVSNEYTLADIQLRYPHATWIHGGAKQGFDAQIQKHIERNQIPHHIYYPEYDKYPPKIAPLHRNTTIAKNCHFLIACYDGRKTGGTHDCIEKAKSMGKPIVYIEARHLKLPKKQEIV